MSKRMSEISAVSMSRDGSSFGISLEHSFSVYNTDPLRRKFMKDFVSYRIAKIAVTGDGTLVAFSASALSKDQSIEKVFVWSNQFGEAQCQLDFKEKVTSVALTPHFLLVVLEKSIVVYDIERRKTQCEMVTCSNPHGAGDIVTNEGGSLIAVSGLAAGGVSVNDLTGGGRPVVFQAHQHPVSLIRLSPDGSIVATASERGTLIRLFDSVTGSHLCVFRRGTMSSRVLSVCFSPGNSELIAVSESGTVHLFDGDTRNTPDSDPPRSIAKLNIGKVSAADCVFVNEDDLVIVTSTGQIHTAKCNGRELDSAGKAFLLSH